MSNIYANLSAEEVEALSPTDFITYLNSKKVVLFLDDDHINILASQGLAGSNFLKLTTERLINPPYNFLHGPAGRIADFVSQLNSQIGLTLEEALSCIPPPASIGKLSKSVPNSGDHVPDDIFLWDDFLESVNQYEFTGVERYQRPQFSRSRSGVGEMSAQAIFEFNICEVLNDLLPGYEFSRRNTNNPGDPDFTCFFAQSIQSTLLFPIEVRLDCLLEVGKVQFPEFYKKSTEARAVIKQIFSYMVENERQYGVLSTYNKHWFLYRPRNDPKKLWISETLKSSSESPPVLKTYAYMVKLCCDGDDSYFSPHLLKIPGKDKGSVSKHTRSLRPRTKSSSYNSSSSSSILYKSQKNNQNLSFMDFKFNGILGNGRSGKTLKCEFRGNTIALKCTDLWKSPPCILKEMQNEVKIYQILSTIQGERIPKLMCYGYYGGGMCYVIGTSFVGTALTKYNHITERQRIMGICALNAIHSKGVLHNDIRAENILLNDNNVYLIDFGMASYHHDVKECWELFAEEKHKLAHLLNQYQYPFPNPC